LLIIKIYKYKKIILKKKFYHKTLINESKI